MTILNAGIISVGGGGGGASGGAVAGNDAGGGVFYGRTQSGSGVLKRIVVNKIGSSSNTCTIYDNTSGTGTIMAIS